MIINVEMAIALYYLHTPLHNYPPLLLLLVTVIGTFLTKTS